MKKLTEKMNRMANDGDWRIYAGLVLLGGIFAIADIKWSEYFRNKKKNH